MDTCTDEASKALGRTMRKINKNYENDKNREAFSQSQTIALRLYFDYIQKLEPRAES
jgi:hypothetical protein